jgi:hypothetical protein
VRGATVDLGKLGQQLWGMKMLVCIAAIGTTEDLIQDIIQYEMHHEKRHNDEHTKILEMIPFHLVSMFNMHACR